MSRPLARRNFLAGSLAAVAVFLPGSRSWASSANAGPGAIHLPSLDGQLLADAATLAAAADDYGHIVHHTPRAVLVPGSIHDLEKLVKFAGDHGIKVAAARGIGESHSTQGQSQVEAGVVIDMSALDAIEEISSDSVLVQAGVRWIDLLGVTVPLGKSPPTLTDFIELSVGGTLSVGGIGGQAFRHGLQIDNVLELEVINGRGQRITCSPTHKAEVFNAVLGGLGQFGILVKARLKLVPVLPQARTYTAVYPTIQGFTADAEMLIDTDRFDYVEGAASQSPDGSFVYVLQATRYFDTGSPPDDAAQLAGLSFLPGTQATQDQTYFDFANRLAPLVAFLRQIGAWGLPHPWLNLFIPGPAAPSFIQSVLDDTTPDDMGQGPILLYPFKRARVTRPNSSLPSSPTVYILSLLRNAIPPIPPVIAGLVAKNRSAFDAVTAIGGKRYPIDSVPMSQADWQAHFGPRFAALQALKADLDPQHVLTPGQGIF